jgi:hypothetical protein
MAPLARSIATSGRPPSARMFRPVSGSNATRSRLGAIFVAFFVQLTPLSEERMTDIHSPREPSAFLWMENALKKSRTSPFFATRIWLPIVPVNSLWS